MQGTRHAELVAIDGMLAACDGDFAACRFDRCAQCFVHLYLTDQSR